VFRLGSRAAITAAAALAAVAGLATPAFASTSARAGFFGGASNAVFVQTGNTAGNQVIAYQRAANGTLTQAGSYATDGVGGVLAGSVVDHQASQGSLGYDPGRGLLFATNAGSNTVSVFQVNGDHLALHQIVNSGGVFPVSVAVRGDFVYVLNALGGGSVQGYFIVGDYLVQIPGSSRALGLNPTASPQFTNTPGQVAFTPDGAWLVVTTKANGNDIDLFRVGFAGQLSAQPVVNAEPGTVPFAITYDQFGNLVIANAGNSSLTTFAIGANGTLTSLDSVPTGEAATCWVAPAGQYLYASNAGSASVTGFTSAFGGQLTDLGNTSTDAGTVDAAATADGRYLYVRTGATGNIDEFSVGAGGSLTELGSVTVPNAAGGEGILVF
jgi:6-phosphogluconolactonase (cycloisomerase 2 family)